MVRFIPDSAEVHRAFVEADIIARRQESKAVSAHLLWALFTFPNRALLLLEERGIDLHPADQEAALTVDEAKETLSLLRERARAIAMGAGAKEVDCLHLLIAMTRIRHTSAHYLLERCGSGLTELRNMAVGYVTGKQLPRRYRALAVQAAMVNSEATGKIRPERPILDSARFEDPCHDADALDDSGYDLPLYAESDDFDSDDCDQVPALTEGLHLPTLQRCGVNLTAQAQCGQLDDVVGRERELARLVDILGKRRANNPVLVGPPGVGKTAIVEGLARKVARQDPDVAHLHETIIFALDTGSMVAGTSLRGAFSERMTAIKREVAQAGGRVIVFIDELHTLIGAGSSGDGPHDAANELKSALARGEFPCIGATTEQEFKKHIERDPALERRFTPIYIDEPSTEQAVKILHAGIVPYAAHHHVDYQLDAIHAAVHLTHRFLPERRLPDKAFAVLDLAGSRSKRQNIASVRRSDVAGIVHEWTGIPLERLCEVDQNHLGKAEAFIRERLLGQGQIIDKVCGALRRGFAGFGERRPLSSFLLLGPTGVGKTELVRILAEFLFGRRDAMVRFDMSELSERHGVARLLGAQPGYVGYEEGGQLTEAVRKRPFQVVLFDELDKAHPDVLNVLLQILDEGHLTDAQGRRVTFSNTVVILTANMGCPASLIDSKRLGFSRGGASSHDDAAFTKMVLEEARERLLPELWARLDERLVFQPLLADTIRSIAEMQLQRSASMLQRERGIALTWSKEVLSFLLDKGGLTPGLGARGMRQTIQHHIESPAAERVLAQVLQPGSCLHIDVEADGETLIFAAEQAGDTQAVA